MMKDGQKLKKKLKVSKIFTNKTQWYVYIISTLKGPLYTGITTNLERRLKEHKSHKKGAKFFHLHQAIKIVYYEIHANRSNASKREYEIKTYKRSQKLELIKNFNK